MMKQYDIWRAKVKFEETDEIKERPVLIWRNTAYIIAYKLTGTDRGNNREEYRIQYWREAGLTKETSIRIAKVLRLNESDMIEKIGELDRRDRLMFELRIAG